ncbi:MAG TPA: hypothetical protein VF482_10950 [Trebonia sp.]
MNSTESSGPPFFVELVQRAQAVLTAEDRSRIDATGLCVLAALGMRTGIVHLECRMTAEGPSVIEVAVRMPGDGLMELLEATYGVSWYDLMVLAAMGRGLPELPTGPRRYAASYQPPLTGGIITGISGFEKIRDHPRVTSARLGVSVGDLVPTTTSSMELAGQILITAPTAVELEDVLAYVRGSLRIETAPTDKTYRAKFTSADASIYPLF